MARFKIETPLPAGASIADAVRTARLAACDQFNIHVVEQETHPVHVQIAGPDGTLIASPNDGSVDRVLVTWWDLHDLPQGGGQ